jgi:putative peptidoglycan lipid II flippase
MSEAPRDRVGRAATVMAVGTVLSRGTGFLRAAVIAATLGLGLTADMFAVADAIPAALYAIVAGGVLNAVLVPQIVRAMGRDADGGEAYTQRLATAVLLVLGAATLVLVLAAPFVIRLYTGSEYDDPALAPQLDTIVYFARFMLLQVFFYGLYTLLGQLLNARGRFGPMMFAPILNNLIAIAVFGGFLAVMGPLDPDAGAYTRAEATWFAVGSTLGIVAQALVLLPVLHRTGIRLRLRTDLRGVGLGKAFRLASWTLVLIGILQATQLVVVRLATSATASAAVTGVDRAAGLAVYNNSFLIIMVPHSIITVSLATAMLPGLSRDSAAGRLDVVRERVSVALRAATAVIIPFGAVLIALSGPVARVLFGYGAARGDIDLVAATVMAFVPGLVGFTITFMVQRAFNAGEDTRTPALVQMVIATVQIGLAVAIVPRVEPVYVSAVLAGSWSAALLAGAVVASILLGRRIGALGGWRLVGYLLVVAAASLPGSLLVLYGVLATPRIWATSTLGGLLVVGVGTIVAGATYLGLAWVMRVAPVRWGVARARSLVSRRA